MIGNGGKGSVDLSKFLVNFDAAAWANVANQQLQNALSQGLQYSEKYNQQAANVLQGYDQKAQQQMQQGFQQAQQLNAPQRLAAYNALDMYSDLLGVPRAVQGSAQLAGMNTIPQTGLFNGQMIQSQIAPVQNPTGQMIQGGQ